jgi:GTPase SAR1 family protein
MPSSYKSKVIAVGSPDSGKENFFNRCEQIFSSYCDTSYWTIGLSIKIVNYDCDNEDHLDLALWDINPSQRFQLLFPNFLRGASGAIIFINFSNDFLIDEIEHWIEIIRENSGEDVPIYLVGSYLPPNNIIKLKEVLQSVEEKNLEGLYAIPINKRIRNSIVLNHLSIKILNIIRSRPNYLNYNKELEDEQKSLFQDFISYFSYCPICGGENHKSYLSKFYFDKNPNTEILRDKLLRLIEKSERFDHIYENDIKIGIPCCNCFNKLFAD